MTTTSKHTLPDPIVRKLVEVRQLLRSYLTKKWLYMLVCWVLLVFWLGAAVDYLPVRVGSDETPPAVRIGMLLIMASGGLWLLVGWLLPRLFKPISDSSIALLIERQQPELGNRLITAVQVCDSNPDVSDRQAHDQLFQRVLIEASHYASAVNTTRLFNWRPLSLLRVSALAGLLITLVVAVLAWPWFKQWNARLFGLSDALWPRSAVLRADGLQIPLPLFSGQLSAQQIHIAFEDGLARVPAGSSPRLQVSADAAAPKLPEVCTMHYRSDDGNRGRANLRRIGAPREGWQQFILDGPPLDAVSASLSLDIIGLDARLRNLKLEVIEPAVIVDLQLECVYPNYLIDSLSTRSQEELLPYRSGMKIPEGTVCTLVGHSSSMLKQVDYVYHAPMAAEEAEVIIRQALVTNEDFRIPLGPLHASQLVEIRLVDRYGLPSEQVMRYNVTVQADTVPEVESRLDGIGLAITPEALLPIRGSATDDHQIAEVAVEISLDETVLPAIPLQLDNSILTGDIDLQKMISEGKIRIDAGMTLGLGVWASDHYDLGGQQHIGRGQTQQLAVVTADKLLVILDRQELELRRRLEQIISELQQLDEALSSMMAQLTELESANNSRSAPAALHAITLTQLTNATTTAPQTNSEAEQQAADQLAQRQSLHRLAILRAQQGQLQTDKSQQELVGIVNRVAHLRLQLIHNRIDSVDRQQRLLEQVQQPLDNLLAKEYVDLDRQMERLQSAVIAGQGRQPAAEAVQALETVLQALEGIKAALLDIASFNETLDLVRALLDEQERILKATEEAQKARVLDIFK